MELDDFLESEPRLGPPEDSFDDLIWRHLNGVGLHSLLSMAAEQKEIFAEAEGAARERAAEMAVKMLLEAVTVMAGPEIVRAAYGGDDFAGLDPNLPAVRVHHLHLILRRLSLACAVFKKVDEPAAHGSLQSLMWELLAVANGDAPRLTRRIGGRRGKLINTYRSAMYRLRALEWDRYLEAQGLSPGVRHGAIGQAYGAEWTRIDEWPSQTRKALGDEVVDTLLLWAGLGVGPHFDKPALRLDYTPFLHNDGQLFQLEERARAA